MQGLLNNSPSKISLNKDSTLVVTQGGDVYQSGFIKSKIQSEFLDVVSRDISIGHVIDCVAVEDKYYLLNDAGSVFEYQYNSGLGGSREIYTPDSCSGDKAIKIVGGTEHVVIMTNMGKVWGAGSNSEYQLVPQGQCQYDSAVQILITDSNLHDDNPCSLTFSGVLEEHIDVDLCRKATNVASCVKETKCDVLLGYLNYSNISICLDGDECPEIGILGIPIFGDLNYVGILCVGHDGCVSGSVTYNITRMTIKCGCFIARFTTKNEDGCQIREFNVSSTNQIDIFKSTDTGCNSRLDCGTPGILPITGTSTIQGKCGQVADLNLDLPRGFSIPGVAFDPDCQTLLIELNSRRTAIAALCDVNLAGISENYKVVSDLMYQVCLSECTPGTPRQPEMPQPCWKHVFAGYYITVLVDTCNRMYVLGSIYRVRSQPSKGKGGSSLEDLLNKTQASISFPAEELGCIRASKNDMGVCEPKSTDLSRFDVHLAFPGQDDCKQTMNVCDFLNKLKSCSQTSGAGCEGDEIVVEQNCDRYVYLNVSATTTCEDALSVQDVGKIIVWNKRSIERAVLGCPHMHRVEARLSTSIEFGISGYCLGTETVSLNDTLVLDFCNDGPEIVMYVDIDHMGGLRFTRDAVCNVEFSVQSTAISPRKYVLNYGSIMDPVELSNFKYALSNFNESGCRTPYQTKLINTYLRGGDVVRFCMGNPKNIRLAVTPDVATVFRMDRRIVQVAIGMNSLHVLVSGLGCPNEIMALGNNSYGELGLGSHRNSIVFQPIDRRYFDCQVTKIFAGDHITFYITQSGQIYSSGKWKTWVQSSHPEPLRSVCKSWKVDQIRSSTNHTILLGEDGSIFGLGDNSMGELGMGHINLIDRPTPLTFFYDLSNVAVENLYRGARIDIGASYPDHRDSNGRYSGRLDDGQSCRNHHQHQQQARGQQLGHGQQQARRGQHQGLYQGPRQGQRSDDVRQSSRYAPQQDDQQRSKVNHTQHSGVPSFDQFDNFQIPSMIPSSSSDSRDRRGFGATDNRRRPDRSRMQSFQNGY